MALLGGLLPPRQMRRSYLPSLRQTLLPAILLFLMVGFSQAQPDPAAGILPFSTHAGGQVDSIDLATGNVMLNIPVRSKTGKIPISTSLIGNFHEFTSTGGNGTSGIVFTTQFGLNGLSSSAALGWSEYTSYCYIGDTQYEYYTEYDFYFTDGTGAIHGFDPSAYRQYGSCGMSSPAITATATDESGYTVTLGAAPINGTPGPDMVYDRSGDKVLGNIIDPDGAQISSSTQYVNSKWVTTYTDTLGQTALIASLASGPLPFAYTYSYPGEGSGNPLQTAQLNFSNPYPLRTTYGCSSGSDFNGSVTPYIPIGAQMPDGKTMTLSYEATPGYPADTTGRLSKITFSGGGSVSYAYSGGHQGVACTSQESTTLARTVNDGNGHVGTWTYVNSGWLDSYENFTVTVTDPVGDVTTYHFHGEIQTEKIVQDVNLGVLSTTVTCYSGANSSQVACIAPQIQGGILVNQTDVYTSLGSSAPSLVETKLDTHGNVTAVKRYGVGATYPPSGTPASETDTTYDNLGGSCGSIFAYIFDHPCTVTTYDSSGNKAAQTLYTYNAAGHATQTSAWVSGSTYLNSYASYNANGTVASTTDVNGAVTTYGYGCNGMLPTSVTRPLVGATSQTWDCVGGAVTSSTDLNGNVTTNSYDALWRPIQTTFPDLGQSNIAYNPTATPPNITTSRKIDASRYLTTQTNFDGLGRAIRSMVTSDPSGTIYTDTTYNTLGQVYCVTNPYRTTSDPTYGSTCSQYDALGRTLQVTNPDGTTKLMSYTGGATKVQDEGNGSARVSRVYQSDGLGRLTSVCEVTSATQLGNGSTPAGCGQDIAATGFLTSYLYDGLGNITSVSQSGLNSRSYAYDGLSRPSSETNPESGTTTYAYDSCSVGDLCSRTAPKPNQTNPATKVITSYSYDALHRLTQKAYNDGLTLGVFMSYDTCCWWGVSQTNTKGRLQEAWVGTSCCGSAASVFGYDAMGRVNLNVQCTPTNCASPGYTMSYGYDLFSSVTNVAAPRGRPVWVNWRSAVESSGDSPSAR